MPNSAEHSLPLEATRRWLETAVIGLNLCPFAKAVHVKGQIRYVLSAAPDCNTLLDELERELVFLRDVAPEVTDTSLLVIPHLLADFFDFIDFVDLAEVSLRMQGLRGVLQIAHFHPDYIFADALGPDDPANCTNRAPYPTLHLIREASLDRATAAIPDASGIYERNIALARKMGAQGWRSLGINAPKEPTP